jgi:hypothetical protein
VLSRTLLKTASDSLLGSRYYAHFSPPVRLPWHVAHGPPAASYVPTVSSRNGVYSTSQLSCLGDEARERSAHCRGGYTRARAPWNAVMPPRSGEAGR